MNTVSNSKMKGSYATFYSIDPLKEAKLLGTNLVSYLEKLRTKHNASIFKIHPGLKTIACLDHVSATFFFNAKRSILEREEKPRFGPIAIRPQLLGGACPALISAGKTHDNTRNLTEIILKNRSKNLNEAFDKVSKRLFTKWQTKQTVSLYDALLEWSSNISCNWILGMDISLEKAKIWTDNIITVNTDTLITKVLSKVILPTCPRDAIQMNQEMKELIETSPLFTDYKELATQNNVETSTLSNFLIFLCLFNGTGAPTFSLFYAIAKIYSLPPLKQSLCEELKNATENEILNNPILDNVFHEVMRLNTRPRVFYKRAKCDFEMPIANGRKYPIKKGELLLIPTPIIHRDSTVFKNPDQFDHLRFESNTLLKEKIFGYGTSLKSKNPYGCAAANTGQAAWLWKKMFAKFITEVDFEFNVEPTFDFDAFFNFRPRNIKMEDISIKGIGTKIHTSQKRNNPELKKKFLEMAQKVRVKDVKFNKKQYLKLYGLYKQISDGNNPLTPPSPLKVLDREKWIAWNKMKDISREEAMKMYVELASGTKINISTINNNTPSNQAKILQDHLVKIIKKPTTSNTNLSANFSLIGLAPEIQSQLQLDITVIGEDKEQTSTIVLLPKSSSEKFKNNWNIEIPYLGKPQIIKLTATPLDKNDVGEWFLEKIELSFEEVGASSTFLHNATVSIPSNELILFESKGYLPQNESLAQKEGREEYIQKQKESFQWKKVKNLPSYTDFEDYGDLHQDEQFQEKGYTIKGIETQDIEEKPTSFEYYLERTKLNDRPIPRLAINDRWMKDEEFGRLYLQGTHCNFIEGCRQLPSDFNLDSTTYIPKANCTLGNILESKLLYIANYKILIDTIPPKGRFLTAPIVLFYSEIDTGNLWPIAIQLEREGNSIVFTPQDTTEDWLFAKMWCRTADMSVHQLASHFLLTHAVTEAFATSARRTFPSYHPVLQLLLPHFKHTLAINTLARVALLNEGGWIDKFGSFGQDVQAKVMKKAYEESSLQNYMHFPRNIKSRGVEDTTHLPHYPYRDDGMLIWNAIQKYVHSIISIYYKEDKDVVSDFLLNQWLKELKKNSYSYSDWGVELKSIEELENLLTAFIFNATAIHGAMNILQYEIYGFVPNSPAAMYKAPPKEKGQTTKEYILSSLPGNQTALIFLFLSEKFEEDIKLGADKHIYSSNKDFRYAILQFKRELEEVEQIITTRNKNREVPYIAMLPSCIPNSIDL